ncbi:hypothetical protein [Nocardia sp. NPDC005998]|uniref:hypothetical protein n=1 Tax=Nocardia sp. NPDC005998 TaxID=3156894 RepID=UPI0033B9DBD9
MAEPGTMLLSNNSSVPPTRFAGLRGGPAKPVASAMPRGDLTAAGSEQIQQVVRDVWPGGPDAVRRRARGARFMLEHLAGFPGSDWQQRWEASGLNERGRPVTAVRGKQAERDEICVGTACLFSLRVIRPSLQAFRSTRFLRYGDRFLTAQHDPLLEKFWKCVQDNAVHPLHHGSALFDTAAALDEIEEDLLARRARAAHENWLGELEGIDLTLSFLRQKREETKRLARIAPVELGLPSLR